MKYLKFLILLMLPFVGFAQNDKPSKQHKFGVGLGYNFNSVMGDSIRPLEVSFRYKLNEKHTFQLYMPFMKSTSFYRTETPAFIAIGTVLDIKKEALGIGIGYDYSLFSYSFIDILLGAKLEYLSYRQDTDISNVYHWPDFEIDHLSRAVDYILYSKKGSHLGISPSIGFRANFRGFSFDAKYLLSGLFVTKSSALNWRTFIDNQSPDEIMEVDKIEPSSKHTKLQSALALSISYFF